MSKYKKVFKNKILLKVILKQAHNKLKIFNKTRNLFFIDIDDRQLNFFI